MPDGAHNDYASRWEREVEKRIGDAEADLKVTKRDYELTAKHIQSSLLEIMGEMKGVRESLQDGGQKFTALSGKIEHLTECTMTCDDFNEKMKSFMEGRTECQAVFTKEFKTINGKIEDMKTKVERHDTYFQIIGVVVAFIGTGFLGLFGQFMGWWFSQT